MRRSKVQAVAHRATFQLSVADIKNTAYVLDLCFERPRKTQARKTHHKGGCGGRNDLIPAVKHNCPIKNPFKEQSFYSRAITALFSGDAVTNMEKVIFSDM